MNLHALVVAVAALLLVPLLWSALVAATRGRDGAPLESAAEVRVLAIMLAPIAIGAACLLWAAAPRPYALPPLLPDAHLFEDSPAIVSHSANVARPAWAVDWLGLGAATLAAAYALGFVFAAARLILAQARIARIEAHARPASARWGEGVAVTEARVSAFVGMSGKVILSRSLIETLTPAQIALIIAHERSHLRRGDAYAFAAFAWIDALWWFNPFVRAQTRACRLAAELACDAAATAGAPDMRKAYAQALIVALKHAAGDALPCAPAVFSTWILGDHRMRIARIMSPASAPRKFAGWGVYVAACVLAAPIAVMQLAIAQPSVAAAVELQPASAPPPSAASAASVFSFVPVSGRISSPFGRRDDPITGKPALHVGVDFAAPEGTEIVAPAAGRVVRVVQQDWGYGKVITIDHGDGLVTRFAHLSAFEVSEGQHVDAGQAIGRVGSTGRSTTGPHLHFEVWRNRRPIDPAPLLPAPH